MVRTLILLAGVALAGCLDLELGADDCASTAETRRCAVEPDPPHCVEYFNACINAAVAVYLVDIDRVGPDLARETYARHQSTCDDGMATCVAQDRRARAAAIDGGPGDVNPVGAGR